MSLTDKLKNATQKFTGQAKQRAGKATGDQSLQAEGKGDEVSGNLKNAGENVKNAFKG